MKRRRLTTELFIEDILCGEVHPDGKYSYKMVEYVSSNKKIEIYCNDCGESFTQKPYHHKQGHGCPKCSRNKKLTTGKILQFLTIEEEPIEVGGEVQCKCSYCKEYFIPTRKQLHHRISSLSGDHGGESRLYCSDKCKQQCPIFYKQKHSGISKSNTSRSVQPELKQIVLERDNNKCQRCDSTTNLHCHHITGVEVNPVESSDIDNCITLCYTCHSRVHSSGQCDVRRKPCGSII
jgi:hypothetical protein